MKKAIFTFLFFLSLASFAQVSSGYVFSYVTSPTHAFVTGGTTLASGNGASMDDALYTNVPIGFAANFNGTDYTTVGVSTNGFLWFGTVNPAATEYTPISSATAMSGVISGYGANLVGRVAAAFIKYTTTGTCPNRVFTVEWNNMLVSGITSGTTFSPNRIDIQVTITEGSNNIDIHCYDSPYLVNATYFGQVGLRGASNTDFNLRSVVCGNLWNNSLAGTVNTASCRISSAGCSCFPAANARYRFTNQSTASSITWNGSTGSDWFTPANWTPATVPTIYRNVTIPSGLSTYPLLTGSGTSFCKSLTIATGASLTTDAGYTGTLTVMNNLANDGTITNNGSNYINLSSTAACTISGAGDFTNADLALTGSCSNYSLSNNLIIRKVNIGTGATLNMNTFNMIVTNSFIQVGTINQSTGTLQIEDPACTLTNATFTEATGTTYFAIGTNTTANNQLVPSITYYNLRVNTINGFTASIGNGSTVSCTNLVINNPAVSGGIAQAVNAVAVSGNFDLAPTGNTPTVNLSSNITVGGTMTLCKGIINTAANKVIINNSAATAVAAGAGNTDYTISYINGNLRRAIASAAVANYDFPMGDASNPRYIILMDNALSGGGFTYIDAYFGALSNHSDAAMVATEPTEAGITYDHICTEGVWFLDPDNQPAAGTYDIKAYINAFAGLIDDQYAILKRPSNSTTGADWTNGGLTPYRPAAGSAGRIVSSGFALRYGLSSFSQFGIASHPVAPLPIELLSFTGKSSGNANLLEWITATERNNDRFIVERSANGLEFSAIGTVSGAGNSTQQLSYLLMDETPLNGTSYYRLKQIDFDGQYTYSRVIALDRNINTFEVLNACTVADQLEITISCSGDCLVKLELYDMQGKKVYASMENTSAANKVVIPVAALSEGIYLLKATTENATLSRKIKR